jgi:hypothetical protein
VNKCIKIEAAGEGAEHAAGKGWADWAAVLVFSLANLIFFSTQVLSPIEELHYLEVNV